MTLPLKTWLCLTLLLLGACTDHQAEARRAKEEADAKARAAATRKEMDALPKTFQTPDYFKKTDKKAKPAQAPEPASKPSP